MRTQFLREDIPDKTFFFRGELAEGRIVYRVYKKMV